MSASAAFGAGGPKGKHVCRPIEVEGVVATIDDALYEPYVRSDSMFVFAGDSSGSLFFDVPDGKRLIIETVTFNAVTIAGVTANVRLNVNVNGSLQTSYLSYETRTSVHSIYDPNVSRIAHLGTHPLRLRVDYQPGSTNEVTFAVTQRPADVGPCEFSASVFGYLVDI